MYLAAIAFKTLAKLTGRIVFTTMCMEDRGTLIVLGGLLPTIRTNIKMTLSLRYLSWPTIRYSRGEVERSSQTVIAMAKGWNYHMAIRYLTLY